MVYWNVSLFLGVLICFDLMVLICLLMVMGSLLVSCFIENKIEFIFILFKSIWINGFCEKIDDEKLMVFKYIRKIII